MISSSRIKQILPLSILIGLFMFSCHLPRKDNIKIIVQEWQGKEILIPSEIEYKTLGRSTANSALWNSTYKILTYIDSIGCSSCQLGLSEWKALIDSCNLQKLDVSFLFIVHSSDFSHFDREVRLYQFDYPIIYDYQNQFHKLNRFPSVPFRTFLLDKDNKVQLIGSPINNPNIWDLYKKVIAQSQ